MRDSRKVPTNWSEQGPDRQRLAPESSILHPGLCSCKSKYSANSSGWSRSRKASAPTPAVIPCSSLLRVKPCAPAGFDLRRFPRVECVDQPSGNRILAARRPVALYERRLIGIVVAVFQARQQMVRDAPLDRPGEFLEPQHLPS